ncbi:replication regulatory protein RepA [Klebsiella sp. WOUb02]|uniref:replication regulatory protein RepA n=1 Tax=Klebsiella sp. WOUb02 TaxID=3161071 RepID=UPI003CE7410C
MSQIVSAKTSSSKRAYRKGNPLTGAEIKRRSILRKKETHTAINVFIQNELKSVLLQLCEDSGLTQTEMIEQLILKEKAAKS